MIIKLTKRNDNNMAKIKKNKRPMNEQTKSWKSNTFVYNDILEPQKPNKFFMELQNRSTVICH